MNKKLACGLAVVGLLSGCSNITVSQPKPSVSTEGYSIDRQNRYQKSIQNFEQQGYPTRQAERAASKQNPPGGKVYRDSLFNVLTGKSGK